MEYSEEDARAWLNTVEFVDDTRVVKGDVVSKCVDILKKAGVIPKEGGVPVGGMVVKVD